MCCTNDSDYSYTVTGAPANGGPEGSHDPKITNNRDG